MNRGKCRQVIRGQRWQAGITTVYFILSLANRNVVTLPAPGDYEFRLTATTTTTSPFSTYDEVLIHHDDEVLEVYAGDYIERAVEDPLTLTLSGTASFTSSDAISVTWTQTSGDPAVIATPGSLSTAVTLPKHGYYTFALTAQTTHNGRNYTETSFVVVYHADYEFIVSAGDSQNLDADDPFTTTLAGEASFAGGGCLAYAWTQTFGDDATISSPTTLNTSVSLSGPGFYQFSLTVTTSTTPPRTESSTVTIFHE